MDDFLITRVIRHNDGVQSVGATGVVISVPARPTFRAVGSNALESPDHKVFHVPWARAGRKLGRGHSRSA